MNQTLPRFLAVFLFASSLLFQSLTASATVSITGIWQWGWHKMIFNGVQTYSPGGTIRIKQSGKLIHFQLSLTAGPPGSNMGLLDGTFMLHGAKGVYRDNRNKCIIYFTILESKSAIKLRQSNRYRPDSYPCNFGYGVFADGIYKRVSTESPSLLGIGGPYSHK